MKIYADVLFAINFSMDLISLYLTCSLLKRKPHKMRMLFSAIIGGLYGVLSIILPMEAFLSAFFGMSISLLMCFVAFYEKSIKRLTSLYAIYWGISVCLGGFMSVLYSFLNKLLAEYIKNYSYSQVYTGARFFVVAMLSIILSIVLGRFFVGEKSVKEALLEVNFNGRVYELKGLCDSGNLLTEPISGRNVILVSKSSVLGTEIEKIEDVYKRYIPYSGVESEGVLKGVLLKTIKIDGFERVAIIAPISKNNFAGYDACIPMSLT